MTDPDAAPYRTAFDWREDSPAMAVASAIAEATDLGLMAFELADYVDPNALDALFRPRLNGTPRLGGRVEFTVEGRRVVVRATGEVAVFPANTDTDGDADGDAANEDAPD